MARHFPTGIDLHGASLLSALLNPLSADPTGLGAGDEGRVWWNSTTNTLMAWTGTVAIDLLARANHTGTQLANTISNFDTTVWAYTLNQLAAPTADLSINTHKLTNVTDGSSASDAATKGQLDSAVAGLQTGMQMKGAVEVASSSNVVLATPGATIDGVTMSNPMTVLLAGQTVATQNGPYLWTGAAVPLVRATNWDTSAEAVLGSYWVVKQGTQADTFAVLTNDTAITLGTSSPAFVFRGAASVTLTPGNGIDISGTAISAKPVSGGYITNGGSGFDVDVAKITRYKSGIIPTSTTGIVSVSGANITINHGLANSAPLVVIRAYSSPLAPYTQGQEVAFDVVASDANNVTLTLPANPASNNWAYTVMG